MITISIQCLTSYNHSYLQMVVIATSSYVNYRPFPASVCSRSTSCLSTIEPSTDASLTHRHSLGSFNIQCPSCHAFHWIDERLTKSTVGTPSFGMYCNSGKVSWPMISDPPEPLRSLLDGTNQSSGMYIVSPMVIHRGERVLRKHPKL